MNGLKNDKEKIRYDLVPVSAHEALAAVLTYGANKYSDRNYENVETHRYVAALFRHINAWRKGDSTDSESGLHHLSHALANVAILLDRELKANSGCETVTHNGLTETDLQEMYIEIEGRKDILTEKEEEYLLSLQNR